MKERQGGSSSRPARAPRSGDDDRRIRRVEKVATNRQHLGTALAMTNASIAGVVAIGPGTASSRGETGLQCHFSAPYSLRQNGVVEQPNQTVVAMECALLKQRSMPTEFWGDAVSIAVLLNRAPTKSLTEKTTYQAWHGRKQEVHYLHTFGCYMSRNRGTCASSMTAALPLSSSAMRKESRHIGCWTLRRGRIARNIISDEEHGWDWAA